MYALLVQHPVADFDKWKAGFDAHEGVRREMGVTMTNVHRVTDDPNNVVVFVGVKDVDAALKAFGSDDMKEAQKNAGVLAPPTVEVLENRGMDLGPSDSKAGVLFRHPVADFDKWKTVFLSHDAARRSEGGADGWSVNTLKDDGSAVVGYIRTTDMEKLKAFSDSSDLKEAMATAGVTGPPSFTFLDHVEMKRYE
jgi:hypothetical protein